MQGLKQGEENIGETLQNTGTGEGRLVTLWPVTQAWGRLSTLWLDTPNCYNFTKHLIGNKFLLPYHSPFSDYICPEHTFIYAFASSLTTWSTSVYHRNVINRTVRCSSGRRPPSLSLLRSGTLPEATAIFIYCVIFFFSSSNFYCSRFLKKRISRLA